ncbi:unnamed protein product [Durusdinium trenchii]|uniref:GH16 domain-containing protein n=1 Tax=Durusdinium trenchii TaxID=1381693 RepID=A0ABP0PWG7_9DINO
MAILAQEPPVSSDMYEFEILLLVVYLLGLSSGVLLSWALHGGSVAPPDGIADAIGTMRLPRDQKYWSQEVQIPAQNFIARGGGGKKMNRTDAEEWNILAEEDYEMAKQLCEGEIDHGHFAPACRAMSMARRSGQFGTVRALRDANRPEGYGHKDAEESNEMVERMVLLCMMLSRCRIRAEAPKKHAEATACKAGGKRIEVILQLELRTPHIGCGGLDDPRNADCADAVQWAYEKGIKTHPGWYFIPLGKISQIGPADAKLNDLQCGLPPCGCSRPPCHMCEAPEVAPKLSKATDECQPADGARDPKREFDIVQLPDQNMTHSCSNYVDDGQTVFTSNGRLVLKVASACPDGSCLNSGRVMSRDAFTYGVFTFSAKVPKCNAVWPALWFLPQSSKGDGKYGPWPCSGEIDLLETVNDDSHGAFNLVAGFGAAAGRCYDPAAVSCNACAPPSYCTSTTLADAEASHVLVEDVDCAAGQNSWKEHLFVLVWQPHEISAFLDPKLSFNSQGQLVAIQEKIRPGAPTFKTYQRDTTPTWSAVQDYMQKCFPGPHSPDAPFDIPMKIVLNIAVGGYGGAPCYWGEKTCASSCGGAVGSELILSDISVWQ